MMTHIHLTALALALVLFFVVFGLFAAKKAKIANVLHQITRVVYLIVIMTGFLLLPMMPFTLGRISKVVLGLITIGLMEIVLVHQSKGEIKARDWVLFIVFLIATIFAGLLLPLGFNLSR